MTVKTEDFTAVTTHSRRKRHWAMLGRDSYLTREYRKPGRLGYTLCGGYSGMDQERLDHDTRMWGSGKPAPVIADMDPCKQCDKSRQRRIEGRS